MLPPLRILKTTLRRTTEMLAHQLAKPREDTPDWNELEWRTAMAVAAAHGISPLLCTLPRWDDLAWSQFLVDQRAHVEHRCGRIFALLERIDAAACAEGVAVVPLKGSALHAPGLYLPGDRPMADIDLLVHERDAEKVGGLLQALGYAESFAQWKHRVFKPLEGSPPAVLGEHRDTPINIELHTHIQERLPMHTVDITDRIYPSEPQPGLNPYPSTAALLSHLLLHAAGNICNRTLRLIHLNDIALLAMRVPPSEWEALWGTHASNDTPWWALPPLTLTARYYGDAVLAKLRDPLETQCPALLRTISHHQTLTQVSCSELWLHAFAGVEWSRSLGEAKSYVTNRVRPSKETMQERSDMVRTQLWLRDQPWVTQSRGRRMLRWLTSGAPRMDTLYVVRAALAYPAALE
ncbi:Uncharacterised nucleotidyltransferase [Dyella sp. OK004]|uniref:nucleotidyltransferase family protein n=1 Tax=Dyella sp. OK004 TaxID=1855292 RepID=UPI0008DFF6F5|nr:nucleotidyltransferase family protein [Dyella sp. OK004]SFS19923.1 Uncharacterised nucleotidyltransferase [Dyella sp. OK004]